MDDFSGYYEDCWTEDGYDYCETIYVVEYECYAHLHLSWNVSGVEYSGWAYTPSIITPYGCLEIMKDSLPDWRYRANLVRGLRPQRISGIHRCSRQPGVHPMVRDNVPLCRGP